MIRVDVARAKQLSRDVDHGSIGEHLRDPKAALWVEVSDPTDTDWRTLREQFPFHPLSIEDASRQEQRPKVDEYPGYLFLTVRAWRKGAEPTAGAREATAEIDVFLGANYLVTVHYGEVEPITQIRARWRQHPDLVPCSASYLLYVLLDTVVDAFFPALDELDEAIDGVESAAYSGGDVAMGEAMLLKRRLLVLRQAVAPTRDMLNQLLRVDMPIIDNGVRLYLQDVYDHALRLVEQVDLHREILSGALDAMVAQVSNRLNQVMKTLTSLSTIMMSVGLVAGIYGMNFRHMPELELQWGYFFALGAMALVAAALVLYFRRIRWL
ncbi:MAG: magnesium/cobalt transporter CorA [Chthonomonadales bacterium]|nr:magnesium/cobalt transporter CorA [Chthonomonadales bacterium]